MSEQEIQLLNLFRRVDEIDRLTIISLLESRPVAAGKSASALTLIQGGRSVLNASTGSIAHEGSAGLVARTV